MTKRDLLIFLFKWRATILGLWAVVIAVATLVAYLVPPTYVAKARILVERNRSPVMRTMLSPAMDLAEALNTESEILLSRTVMTAVADELKPHDRPRQETAATRLVGHIRDQVLKLGLIDAEDARERWIDNLQRNVKAKPTIDASVLRVTYADEDRQWAARIVNSTIKHYVQHHAQVFSNQGTVELFFARVEKTEAELQRKRAALAAHKRLLPVAAVDDARRELVRESRSLSEQITDSQNDIAALLTRFERQHPEVGFADARLERLKAKLRDAGNRAQELEAEQARISAMEQGIAVLSDTLRDYTRRYDEARLDEAAGTRMINVGAIDFAAVPGRPEHSRLFVIAIAIAGGAVLSLAVGVMREYFDRRLTKPSDAEDILGIPDLGSVCTLSKRILRAGRSVRASGRIDPQGP